MKLSYLFKNLFGLSLESVYKIKSNIGEQLIFYTLSA